MELRSVHACESESVHECFGGWVGGWGDGWVSGGLRMEGKDGG